MYSANSTPVFLLFFLKSHHCVGIYREFQAVLGLEELAAVLKFAFNDNENIKEILPVVFRKPLFSRLFDVLHILVLDNINLRVRLIM